MNKIEYMLVAELMKRNSQNPKTQTGCCIVDVEGNVIGKGTNALPRGLELTEDDKKRLVEDNDYALNLLEHAERNAIFNAIDNGKVSSLKGSTLYVAYTPCVPCAQAIIAVGIAKVVDFGPKPDFTHHRRGKSWEFVIKNLFPRAGIEYEYLDDFKIENYSAEEIALVKEKYGL